MILHDNFVFIHHPHSAGTFIQNIICLYVPINMDDYKNDLESQGHKLSLDGIKYKNHNGIVDIPDDYKDKFKFGIVKNPYKWYVSYYNYHLRSGTELVNKFKNFDEFMKHMESIYNGNGLGRYSGFFTRLFTFNNQFVNNDILCDMDYLCESSNIVNELFIVFDKTNTKINNKQIDWITNMKKINSSSYKDYRDFYSDELVEKVYKWDKKIIDHFDYKFDKK